MHRPTPFCDYDYKSASDMLNVSVKTVKRAVAAGELDVVRYNARIVRVPHESIVRYRAARMSRSAVSPTGALEILDGVAGAGGKAPTAAKEKAV